MQRHFTSGRGLAFSNQIGDTLTNVFTTAQKLRARASFPTATLRLDAAFVNALYNGLTDAILAVQFGTRRIVHWNREAECMFEYTVQEERAKTVEIHYCAHDSV